MAEHQSITIPAHHNVYTGNAGRELRIDFSIPDNGVNSNTGLIVLVPGFGGNIDSKVYKKMRDNFADKHNMVTLQCSYFGSEFMQSAEGITVPNKDYFVETHLTKAQQIEYWNNNSILLNLLSTHPLNLPVVANINETPDSFNDMGFMQAIDIITAIEAIIIILRENGLSFDEGKVVGYGHSHGAYLLHLINRLAPHLLSGIIDNSAWIEPQYLYAKRFVFQGFGEMTLQIEFDYLAKRLIEDKKALHLGSIYEGYSNKSEIIIFQGTNDNLINYVEKNNIASSISNAMFYLIKDTDVDGEIFHFNGHGLNADFLKLFEYAYVKLETKTKDVQKELKYEIKLSDTAITVDYSRGLPVFSLRVN